MTRRQRTIAISTSAAGAALALVIGLVVALTGSSTCHACSCRLICPIVWPYGRVR